MTRALADVGALVLVALLVLAVYGLCSWSGGPSLQCVRDLSIIVLAIVSLAVVVLLAVIVLLFGRLISVIQEEVEPILTSAKRTVNTVQGTTTFVADSLVAPLISLAGLGSGLRGALVGLAGRGKKKHTRKEEGKDEQG